jgi:hypothetical protein
MKLLIVTAPLTLQRSFSVTPNPGGKQLSEIVKQSQTHYPEYTRGICLGYRQDIPYIDLKGVYYGFTTEKGPVIAKALEFRGRSKVVRM